MAAPAICIFVASLAMYMFFVSSNVWPLIGAADNVPAIPSEKVISKMKAPKVSKPSAATCAGYTNLFGSAAAASVFPSSSALVDVTGAVPLDLEDTSVAIKAHTYPSSTLGPLAR